MFCKGLANVGSALGKAGETEAEDGATVPDER